MDENPKVPTASRSTLLLAESPSQASPGTTGESICNRQTPPGVEIDGQLRSLVGYSSR
jgi:hypothetical protein